MGWDRVGWGEWHSHSGSADMNLTSIHEDNGSLALLRELSTSLAMSCGVGHRLGLDLVLLLAAVSCV